MIKPSIAILIVFVTSYWSWEIFSFNFYLFLLVLITSTILYILILNPSKKLLGIFWIFLFSILIIQFITTKNPNLSYITPTEEQLLNSRRTQLPTTFGRYLQSKPTNMFYKFQQNFFRTSDINIYFFAEHPRERAGIKEFNKFHFICLPFFLIGIFISLKSRSWQLLLALLIPMILLSIIGPDNPLGPFSLYPFFAVSIALGLKKGIFN